MDTRTKRFSRGNLFRTIGIIILLFLVFFTVLPYFIALPQYDENSSPKPFSNSAYSVVDGIKLHYQEWNADEQNPTGKILLVHGFYGSTFTWRKNVSALIEKGFYVIAVDMPGFGYSSKKSRINHSLDSRATLLWDFIDKLDRNYEAGKDLRWVLAGHSLGSAVISKMALQRQDDIDKLILVAPAINNSSNNNFSFLLADPVFKRWTAIFAEYFFFRKDNIKGFLASAYGRDPTQEEIEGYLNPIRQPGTSIAAGDIVSTGQSRVDLSKIKIPTQIIKGEKDSWVQSSEVQKVKNDLEFSIIYEIKNAGHVPQETHEEEFNKTLINFLSI